MNVGKAVSKRGGLQRSWQAGGFAHELGLELTLQFRLEMPGKERLVTYQCAWSLI